MHPSTKNIFGNRPNAISVRFFDGNTMVDGWIVKQLSTFKYRITNGTVVVDSKLPQNDSEVSLANNNNAYFTITAINSLGVSKSVKRLTTYFANFTDGSRFRWSLNSSDTNLFRLINISSAQQIAGVSNNILNFESATESGFVVLISDDI